MICKVGLFFGVIFDFFVGDVFRYMLYDRICNIEGFKLLDDIFVINLMFVDDLVLYFI